MKLTDNDQAVDEGIQLTPSEVYVIEWAMDPDAIRMIKAIKSVAEKCGWGVFQLSGIDEFNGITNEHINPHLRVKRLDKRQGTHGG